MSFTPTDIAYIQIFPPIGISRLGDSGFDLSKGKPDGDIEWFLPSEIPGTEDMPTSLQGQFRDANNRIKRQARLAVRFRVYAYLRDGTILGEITSGSMYTITWSVHVANHKGSYNEYSGEFREEKGLRNPDVQPTLKPEERSQLIVDSQVQKISYPGSPVKLKGSFQGSRSSAEESVDVHLGEIRVDDQGRLIFIGGAGYSRSVGKADTPHFQPDIISGFNSIDWVDDTCDGWVDVEVEISNTLLPPLSLTARQKSTVVSAPPKFAWGMQSPTTLYDLIANIYHEKTGWKDHEETQFYQDIWPIMHGSYALSWTNRDAYDGHGVSGKGNFLTMKDQLATPGATTELIQLLREHVFNRLRLPDYKDPNQASTKYMPRLSGNDGDAYEPGEPLSDKGEPIKRFASLTKLQYERFAKWKDGEFSPAPAPWNNYSSFEEVPISLQPTFLTRAALEHTVGEPLYPGIEMHWSARKPEKYDFIFANISVKEPPFRFDHREVLPGHIGRGLCLPWQSDFFMCSTHW
ncbi:hypothetical protein M405DRAFT_860602 [Rhizopogon salebrosus TDB-379]|nr:hypothetical protein M405DRAFT_860602 [Rhizopogon salebrosus TDB-379]